MSAAPKTAIAGVRTYLCPIFDFAGLGAGLETQCELASPLYTITAQDTHIFTFVATLPEGWKGQDHLYINLCHWVRLTDSKSMNFFYTFEVDRGGQAFILPKAAGRTTSQRPMPSPSADHHLVVMRHNELNYSGLPQDTIRIKLWANPQNTTNLSSAGATETGWGTFSATL